MTLLAKLVKTTCVLLSLTIISCDGSNGSNTPSEIQITEQQSTEWKTVKAIEISTNDFIFEAISAGPNDGIPVILLHGFAATSFQYSEILKNLGGAGYYAIAPDQRGYSPRARPDNIEDYRLDLLAQDVIDIADSLNIYQFHLVGHDYGAQVSWAVGSLYPDRLLSLSPISVPHPKAFVQAVSDPNSNQDQLSSYASNYRLTDYEDVLLANSNALLLDFYSPIDTGYTEEYIKVVANKTTLKAALNWYRAADWEWNLALPSIATPTLLIWGDNDQFIAPEGIYATGNFIQGPYQLEVFEGTDHFIPEADPKTLSELLVDHFE